LSKFYEIGSIFVRLGTATNMTCKPCDFKRLVKSLWIFNFADEFDL
jgi:hypothetical protein